jgi:ribosomal protein L37E
MMLFVRARRCLACGLQRDQGLDDKKFTILAVAFVMADRERKVGKLMITCKRCGYGWDEPPYGEVPGEA